MSAPLLPRSDATDASAALHEGASNDGQFVAAPAAAPTGWDPYEVWRTRVFAMQPAGYNKGRGNT